VQCILRAEWLLAFDINSSSRVVLSVVRQFKLHFLLCNYSLVVYKLPPKPYPHFQI
jgi:hypothetical protein